MYQPIGSRRLFTFDTRYDQINWNSLQSVVEAHKQQLEYWYVLPCRALVTESHFSFAVIALTSMLVDTLSQFEAGSRESDGGRFRSYLRRHILETATRFSPSIRTSRGPVADGADALYAGIRCGILHEAHPPLYTGIQEQASLLVFEPTGFATYDDGTPCPVVSVCPRLYFERVTRLVEEYWRNLLDPSSNYDRLRMNFAQKIKHSFGLTISIDPAT